MKKQKKQLIILLLLCAVVLGVGGSVVYNQFAPNSSEEDGSMIQSNNEGTATVILAAHEFITLEDGIKDSDLVVEVEILGKDREEGIDDESVMPQTIHSARILEVFSGELSVGDMIYVFQDGIDGNMINNIPIYQTGEKYIFTLNAAEPKEEYPNTYWATKVYFSTDEEVVDLNFGDSEFEETIASQDAEAIAKKDEIDNETSVDGINVQVLKKSVVVDKIEKVIENEGVNFSVSQRASET